MIKDLPIEISQMILSKLDNQSLLNAAQVSKTWLSTTKSTSNFRQRIHRHIRFRNNKLSQIRPKSKSSYTNQSLLRLYQFHSRK
ncbi:hypothetical protein TSAR_007282 [Trichomalopsis sarcophagae]|uniref:F-box domain-containing protein n=1 Tax=Trichomalopsis sarcophagae TaxID=543379 RepID=A0A232F3U8_9HYME|nr:hypothetical protein TSAR_007282 [Trichomalopsis sarcophagae]